MNRFNVDKDIEDIKETFKSMNRTMDSIEFHTDRIHSNLDNMLEQQTKKSDLLEKIREELLKYEAYEEAKNKKEKDSHLKLVYSNKESAI